MSKLKVEISPSKKNYLLQLMPSQNDAEKAREEKEKEKVNFKIYNVTTWLKTVTVHVLPNISRSKKDNQTMKFGQLIEYNKINIFIQKSCGK